MAVVGQHAMIANDADAPTTGNSCCTVSRSTRGRSRNVCVCVCMGLAVLERMLKCQAKGLVGTRWAITRELMDGIKAVNARIAIR